MTTINLTPIARNYIVNSGDSWVFKIRMFQVLAGTPAPLDISAYSFKATLMQKIDGAWNRFTDFTITNSPFSNQNMLNGIYLDSSDILQSTLILAFDWMTTQPDTSLIQDGTYQLVMTYQSPIGYRKTFLKYLVEVTEEIKEGNYATINNVEYCITEIPAAVSVNIYNTAINQIN